MRDFISAALPWILVGLALAITAVGYAAEQKQEKKAQKRLQLVFMAVGMILGVTVNGIGLLPWDHSLVISLFTLWGLAIGTCVDAK